MTDTTKKAMPLEQVRDCLRGKTYKSMEEAAANPMPSLNQLADAIDAHLAAQRECGVIYQIKASSNDSQDVWIDCDKDSAEHNRDTHGCIMRVVYIAPPTPREGEAVVKPSHWAAIDEEGDIQHAYSCDDGNGGEAARTEMNQWINDQLHPGMYHLVPLYTAPPPPRVGVPDGWKLVPIKPTQKMLDAPAHMWHPEALNVWNAMLAAAPPHPRVGVTDEMVNRACQAFFVGNVRKPWPWRETQDMDEPDAVFAQMRAALEAALSEKGHE